MWIFSWIILYLSGCVVWKHIVKGKERVQALPSKRAKNRFLNNVILTRLRACTFGLSLICFFVVCLKILSSNVKLICCQHLYTSRRQIVFVLPREVIRYRVADFPIWPTIGCSLMFLMICPICNAFLQIYFLGRKQ